MLYNWEITEFLEVIEVTVSTYHVHFANVMFDIGYVTLNHSTFILRQNLVEEIVTFVNVTECPASIAVGYRLDTWCPTI